MNIKNTTYFICLSIMLFGCNLNVNQNDNKNPKENEIEIITSTENKDIVITEKKMFENIFSSQIQDFKIFNGDKGLVFLENGDLLLISDDKLEKIDELGLSDEGSICLNSKGNGLILSVLSSDRHFEKESTLYASRLENYKVVEKKIVLDNQIYAIRKPECSVDEDGNGLLIYPMYYIKKISNYKISDKVMNVERVPYFILNKENILKLTTEDNKNSKLQNIKIDSLVSKEVVLENVPLGNYVVSQNSNMALSILVQHQKDGLELIKIKDINNIERIRINGVYDNKIDSFQINEDGNGLIVFSLGDKMSIVKVKNFVLELKSIIEYPHLYEYSIGNDRNFSYTSIIDNKGYLIWHDAKLNFYEPYTLPRNYYSKIDIINSK